MRIAFAVPSIPGSAVRPKVLLDPYGRSVVVPDGIPPARERIRAHRRDRHEKRGGRPHRLRLGGRRAAASEFRVDRHLRDARRRLHAPSQLRRRGGAERDICRHDREDPAPPGTRDHRRGAAADIPVRPAGLPAGLGQLLGIFAGIVLRSSCRLQFAQGRPRARRRVPRSRQGAAPRRHRSDPRRRL